MVKRYRATGIDAIGKVAWGSHICQLYQTKEDLIDILVPFFKAGLQSNEFCMWVTSTPLREDEARAALTKTVENLDDYISMGQIEIVDYSDWYIKTGKFDGDQVLMKWIEKEKWALDNGFDGLRLTGNTFWLEHRDWKSFVDYEATVDGVITRHRMLVLCTYTTDKYGSPELVDVVSNHRLVIVRRGGKWELIRNTRRIHASALPSSDLSLSGTGHDPDLSRDRKSLLSVGEAAKVLNIHANTIRRWSDEGILRSIRIGSRGDRRFKRQDLGNFLRKGIPTGRDFK